MKNNFKLLIFIGLIFCSTVFFSGCVFLVGGAVGAASGYAALSPDTIEGMVDKENDNVWDASIRVANILGDVKFKDPNKGYIEAEVGKSKVNIIIEKITEETTKIRIKARKLYKLMPDLGLAQKVYTKIMQEAE